MFNLPDGIEISRCLKINLSANTVLTTIVIPSVNYALECKIWLYCEIIDSLSAAAGVTAGS